MATGGGFCEKHGPFDPPHKACPYCAMEEAQRRAYGPPLHTQPSAPKPQPPAPPPDEAAPPPAANDSEPPAPEEGPLLTEMIPRDDAGQNVEDAAGPDQLLPLGWFVVKEPLDRRGEVLPVRQNHIIGREGDVRFDDLRLSRQHARVTFEPPAGLPDAAPVFHLWPFGTTNPVFINGREIRGATPLHENDEIQLGDTLFVFKELLD